MPEVTWSCKKGLSMESPACRSRGLDGEEDQSWHRASSLCAALGPRRFPGGCCDLVPYPVGDTLSPARASWPPQGLPASLPKEGPVLMVPPLLSPKPQLPPACFPTLAPWPAFGGGSTLVPTPGGAFQEVLPKRTFLVLFLLSWGLWRRELVLAKPLLCTALLGVLACSSPLALKGGLVFAEDGSEAQRGCHYLRPHSISHRPGV